MPTKRKHLFTIARKDKVGQCKAKRCKELSISHGLCGRHFREWDLAGRPDLAYGEGTRVEAAGPSDAERRLTGELALARQVYDASKNVDLATDTGVEYAREALRAIERRRDAHREARDGAIAPLAEQIERIKAWAKPAGLLYDQTIDMLKEKIDASASRHMRATSSGHPPAPPSRAGVRRGRLPARK